MSDYKVPDGWSDFAEQWKQWKKSPYFVSNKGRIKRDGEIRAPRDDSRGHYRVNLTYDGKREEPKIHQMVMDLFGPSKPSGDPVIMHKNNNGQDNKISNLKWGTRQENTQDAYDDGLIDK
jgi:hypothetical protein